MRAMRFPTAPKRARQRALLRSYYKDWVLVLVVIAVFLYIDRLEPFHRQFSVKDVTIQHPFAKEERVPIWLCGVLAGVLPAIIMAAIGIFYRRSYNDVHNSLLGILLTQAIVLMITDSVKIAVGRPRPDFLDRCLNLYDNAAGGSPVPMLEDPINRLSDSSICTRMELLRDGFKSFPSGHASFSFGGLGFLSLYLAGKLHLFDERGHIYKSFVVLTPIVGAALIACSRVADYRHHWHDVTIGSALGLVCAIFSYRQYFPSLTSHRSDAPFVPRIHDEDELPTSLLHHHTHAHHDRPNRPADDPQEEELGPEVSIRDGIEGLSSRAGSFLTAVPKNDPQRAALLTAANGSSFSRSAHDPSLPSHYYQQQWQQRQPQQQQQQQQQQQDHSSLPRLDRQETRSTLNSVEDAYARGHTNAFAFVPLATDRPREEPFTVAVQK
ncbi:hypothetical protein DFQ26_007789 [Actinomortierella ambigua]|nr:hypothetical protein DFQ26_007789 [Actinomortierella ambigua]